MMAVGVQPLEWDSNWLGYPVAQFAVGPQQPAAALLAAVAQARAAGFRLLYLVLPSADADANAAAAACGAWPADAKLTYQMPLTESSALVATPAPAPAAGVHLAPVEEVTSTLQSLALQSGEYSRFRRDARIGYHAFVELYTQWLRQTVARGTVWAATTATGTVGLLAFTQHTGHASIELMAVAATARRQGIGQALVHMARQEAQQQGCGMLQVVTQGANQPAQRLYEQCGFHLLRTEQLYHLWL